MKITTAIGMFFFIIFMMGVKAYVHNANAEAIDMPDNFNTNVYVSEIDRDWVRLAVPLEEGTFTFKVDEILDQIYTNPSHTNEILDTADAACRLYDRVAVPLNQTIKQINTENKGFEIAEYIEFLFGCAIP